VDNNSGPSPTKRASLTIASLTFVAAHTNPSTSKNFMMKFLIATSLSISMLSSLNAHADNVVQVCKTEKHNVIIDQLAGDNFRYRAWNLPKNTQGKPDLEIVQSGAMSSAGTGVCGDTEYHFKKGNIEIDVDNDVNCVEGTPPKDAVGNLWVFINGDMKNHYYCMK
jgi:hypothetical protein